MRLFSSNEPVTPGASETDGRLRGRSDHVLSRMQPGLVYPAPFASAASVFLRGESQANVTRELVAAIVSELRVVVHDECPSVHGSACVAVSFPLWQRFCEDEGRPLPVGMRFESAGPDSPLVPTVLGASPALHRGDYASLWFLLRADVPEAVTRLEEGLAAALQRHGLTADVTMVRTRGSTVDRDDPRGNRVLGGRYHESLRNPVSPVEMLEHVLVGDEDPTGAGGSFVFAQRFNLNWGELHSKTRSEVDAVVGRRAHSDELVPGHDARSHVRSSHTYDDDGHTIKLLRLGYPFGDAPAEQPTGTPLVERAGGATKRDERGVYFIGLARSASRIERILQSQVGAGGFVRDRLLSGSLAVSDLGGFFYAPSIAELDSRRLLDDVASRADGPALEDWTRFPGADWSRLVRHYQERSTNGLMYYNHRDYLYEMSTATGARAGSVEAPSLRVLFLLERLFSRWDDTWYRAQKPDELRPLRSYLEEFFADPVNAETRRGVVGDGSASEAASAIMARSVAVRSGWATRMMLGRLAVDPNGVGRRGGGGMDLCDIHPLDLLAGSMPAQSLAEGKYVIDYCRDDDGENERFAWFARTLSHTSGVGHVVPGYEELLAGGIAGEERRIADAEAALALDPTTAARGAPVSDFFESSRQALRGLAEYLTGLGDCAARRRARLAPHGSQTERQSLSELEARLRHLGAGGAPRTMLEATQLVLSAHVCLHLVGEPVAVGRLDRLLAPFYERDLRTGATTAVAAQEIVDCFWLKLGEKVLLNRVFVDDRQELGNMAMGNRAGPYPKGQSVNQWIQQLTVGGQEPDGTWAFSDVTLFCIRAARRMPFNAPVLSLRVGKTMPDAWSARLFEEAARAILSGGACPILLNDDKIIPALQASGTGIGPGADSPAHALWRSEVSRDDAHDYACDGCYEPQFCGANWFTLGGLPTLHALECALNQGRQMISAGPVDLLGKNLSFRSARADAIGSFDELLSLFYKHLAWQYAKQVDATLADFGRMESVCPSPLLNLFIDDCVARGRDIYGGGARYNVLGPCFTTLANTINSLWAIRAMCFEPASSVATLPELVAALLSNWGESIIDPLVHPTTLQLTDARVVEARERFRYLRGIALSLPRWGRGHEEIDAFGNAICARVAQLAMETVQRPRPDIAARMESLAARFGTPSAPFGGISMQPGVGTFASYVEQGMSCAASADGRLHGQPVATDLSPSPIPVDIPLDRASRQEADLVKVLAGVGSETSFGFSNGAPFDVNIAEGFERGRLVEVLRRFAAGSGTNVLTVTVGDTRTFQRATSSPEAYDLLRVRMGGWTEMFVAMHAVHQAVHPRRPVST